MISELIGSLTTIIVECIKAIASKFANIQKKKNEIESSRIFVDVERIEGRFSSQLSNFYPGQVKKIYTCEEDRVPGLGSSNVMLLKITNPSDEIIRNAKVIIYAQNDYQNTKRVLHAQIPRIVKNEWTIVLLPKTFVSWTLDAYLDGQMNQKKMKYTEQIRYVEVIYTSSKNEALKVEVNSNGLTRHYVNETVVKSFDNSGIYTYGI